MSYQSIDDIQKILSQNTFAHTKHPKKSAGRALGTLLEIITFYLLKAWNLEEYIAIEQRLPEFANENIDHNVEYSLHPSEKIGEYSFKVNELPITAKKITKKLNTTINLNLDKNSNSNRLLYIEQETNKKVLRNSCKIYTTKNRLLIAYLKEINTTEIIVSVYGLYDNPFAFFECKRVGVEEGNKKGPQTIEKAKQGAYVATSISALQKLRFKNGIMGGIIERHNGEFYIDGYTKLLQEIIYGDDSSFLVDFILSVGVVSNHGNWFTSENLNKELRVLAQAYDWLLFLSDEGFSEFINDLLLNPLPELSAARKTFLKSYAENKTNNTFTKVNITLEADLILQEYFSNHIDKIMSWFNVISPTGKSIIELREELTVLSLKNWEEILS